MNIYEQIIEDRLNMYKKDRDDLILLLKNYLPNSTGVDYTVKCILTDNIIISELEDIINKKNKIINTNNNV